MFENTGLFPTEKLTTVHLLFLVCLQLTFDIQDSCLASGWYSFLPVFSLLVLLSVMAEGDTNIQVGSMAKHECVGQEHEQFCLQVIPATLLPHSSSCVIIWTYFVHKKNLSCFPGGLLQHVLVYGVIPVHYVGLFISSWLHESTLCQVLQSVRVLLNGSTTYRISDYQISVPDLYHLQLYWGCILSYHPGD